jgi:hypothetical protein
MSQRTYELENDRMQSRVFLVGLAIAAIGGVLMILWALMV